MSFKNRSTATRSRLFAVVTCLIFLVGCGSSSTPPPPPAANNTVALEVNSGPNNNALNMPYVEVTVCIPGTATFQTIPNIEVDTGSSGLRVLSSALGTLATSLPTLQDSSGDVLQECVEFADLTYVWGPVAVADIEMAGEKASSVPIQIVSATPTLAVPSGCSTSGPSGDLNTVAALGGNGILGVSGFPQDCGGDCTSASGSPLPQYFLCPNNVCAAQGVPTADQLWNPVALFSSSDSNGVLISMPSISASGATSASGSLVFGIGTQSDNALGSAVVYASDASGAIQTTYNSVAYAGIFDTGSTGIYFLDATTLASTGIVACPDDAKVYCPTPTVNFTVTNMGLNGTSAPLSFSIANADTLFSSGNFAFNDLGGPSGVFPETEAEFADFGMPFFYGKNVFVGIIGATPPSGVSVAYGYYAF